MNRKGVMLVAGAAAVALSIASCTSSKPESSGSGEATNGAAPAEAATTVTAPAKASKNYNIQFLQGVAGDQFYITMQCGAQEEAAKLGVTVTTQGPQKFDPTLQKPILDSVVASRPDALLVAPTDVQAMQQPLEQAAAAGIKVVLVDTTTNDPSYRGVGDRQRQRGRRQGGLRGHQEVAARGRQGHGDERRPRHLDH